MKTLVIRAADIPVHSEDWGTLQWLVSAAAGSSDSMTLGRVTIKPGCKNPAHRHPNCEEILFVAYGTIEHTLPEDGSVTLSAGDCIVLPREGGHQATNIGSEDAVLIVAYNAGERMTIGE